MIDSIFSNELKERQCLTWEVLLASFQVSNHNIRASVSMRNIETDIETIASLAATKDGTTTSAHHDKNEDTRCSIGNIIFSDIVDFHRTTIANSLLLPNSHEEMFVLKTRSFSCGRISHIQKHCMNEMVVEEINIIFLARVVVQCTIDS